MQCATQRKSSLPLRTMERLAGDLQRTSSAPPTNEMAAAAARVAQQQQQQQCEASRPSLIVRFRNPNATPSPKPGAQQAHARMEPSAKRIKREAATKDWKWLLWDSAFATEYLHPELGAGWTAVLKESCCVRKDEEKDKVDRLREDVKEPLRLWPKEKYFVRRDFEDMVVTVPLLEWCVRLKYKPDVKTFEATARGGDMAAVK